MSDKKLAKYREKRDFDTSPEPRDNVTEEHKKPIFVIQKHDASHLHYDLRLEIDDVLVSWAVPKGPSTDPSEKRLAIHTEDHPLEYATFEGVIPEGEYGAGAVIVWDTGAYDNLKETDDEKVSMSDALENGEITIFLHGKKLQGGYALIRTSADDDKEQWLLIKMDDEKADARRNPTSTEPKSVLSDRTIEDMREEKG